MKLIVGTDSTWSLRAWICSQLAQISLELNVVDLTETGYKSKILTHSPTGLVPALIVSDLVIHDSLAIAEYFNEYSEGVLYPKSQSERALARSLCLELHSGFMNLRYHCPFSLGKTMPLSELNGDIKND